MLNIEQVKFAQKRLGVIADGINGPKTQKEVAEALLRAKILPSGKGADLLVLYLQGITKARGLYKGILDGLYGPMTDYALDRAMGQTITRRDINPSVLGEPSLRLLKRFSLPYPLIVAWDKRKTVSKVFCHKDAGESLINAFNAVWVEYGLYAIQELGLDLYGGCYDRRKKRGGSEWSMHAYGLAIDIHPEQNRWRWDKSKAVFAQPEYQKFIDIFEGYKWESLGRKHDYDYMHFEYKGVVDVA